MVITRGSRGDSFGDLVLARRNYMAYNETPMKGTTMNLDSVKKFVAKNKPVLAIAIVATATVAAVVIDVALRDNSPIEFTNAPE